MDSATNVTTKEHRHEPLKMTKIPDKQWQKVIVNFGGPFSDGLYNLVVIDRITRYPGVEIVYSTDFKTYKRKIEKYLPHMVHLSN